MNCTITNINKDGFGKGFCNRPILVPYTLVNETVAVETKPRRKFAKLIQVLNKSPDRTEPVCKHFGSCGGCRLQHMSYDAQKKFKEGIILELFKPYAGKIQPIISGPYYYYRNKMEWSFSQDAKGQKFLGLILHDSRGKVGTVTECHLIDPWMNQALDIVRTWWESSTLLAYNHYKNSGHIRTLTLRDSRKTFDRVIILTVSANPDYPIKRDELDRFKNACLALQGQGTLTIILRIHQIVKGSPSQIYEMKLFGPDVFRERFEVDGKELEFQVSPSSFLQPNSFMASVIYEKALELAELQPDDVLYDLYAGIGVFGMCVHHRVQKVISIEINPDACYDATCNRDRLGLSNVELFKGDVADKLADFKASVAFIDPPRVGIGKKVCQQIAKLCQKLVYVSCNPTTQAEDVRELEQLGFQVEAICPIDQFPQTVHIENIVLLKSQL